MKCDINDMECDIGVWRFARHLFFLPNFAVGNLARNPKTIDN